MSEIIGDPPHLEQRIGKPAARSKTVILNALTAILSLGKFVAVVLIAAEENLPVLQTVLPAYWYWPALFVLATANLILRRYTKEAVYFGKKPPLP